MKTKFIFLLTAGLVLTMVSCSRDDDGLGGGGKGAYHNDDKEGLRMFLEQPSAENGKINAEWLGLEISDTKDWQKNEAWVDKVAGLTWNDETPKRLLEIDWTWNNFSGPLDASKWTELKKLRWMGTPINTLDLSKNTELEILECINCQLSSLDVGKNNKLKELSCPLNQITSLDVSYNTALSSLNCNDNQITSLDVKSNTTLTSLSCGGNPINSLDVSSNTALKNFTCGGGQLTELDVSKNTELVFLSCSNSQIKELDVSKNSRLECLYCHACQISELDLKMNTKLICLHCDVNNLTSLNLSANLLLEQIKCNSNHLPLSDLFALSEMIDAQDNFNSKMLGSQNLLPQTVAAGSEIDYSDQNVFKGISTQFEIRTGGVYGDLALPDDYTQIDGKIKFNSTGHFFVHMTNEAIVSSRPDYAAVVIAEIHVL